MLPTLRQRQIWNGPSKQNAIALPLQQEDKAHNPNPAIVHSHGAVNVGHHRRPQTHQTNRTIKGPHVEAMAMPTSAMAALW